MIIFLLLSQTFFLTFEFQVSALSFLLIHRMFIYFILLYKTNHLFFIFSFKKTKINFGGEKDWRFNSFQKAVADFLKKIVQILVPV